MTGFNISPVTGSKSSSSTSTTASKLNVKKAKYQYSGLPTDSYQRDITEKIQNILHGKKSISFKKLLKTDSDIATIYNSLSDDGKKLVDYVISQDDKNKNVTERELRNLYRLMDMDGGNVNGSFYDNDISNHYSRKMIENLAKDTSGTVQNNIKSAHRLTKTTKELESQKQTKHIDLSC